MRDTSRVRKLEVGSREFLSAVFEIEVESRVDKC